MYPQIEGDFDYMFPKESPR